MKRRGGKEQAYCMIPARRRRRLNDSGQLVQGPNPFLFIFSSLLLSVLLFIPYESISCPGQDWRFSLCASIPFLSFTLLSSLSFFSVPLLSQFITHFPFSNFSIFLFQSFTFQQFLFAFHSSSFSSVLLLLLLRPFFVLINVLLSLLLFTSSLNVTISVFFTFLSFLLYLQSFPFSYSFLSLFLVS